MIVNLRWGGGRVLMCITRMLPQESNNVKLFTTASSFEITCTNLNYHHTGCGNFQGDPPKEIPDF